MKQKAVLSFAELRRLAWHQAWKMSATAAQTGPPVALHEVAANLGIRRVELLPLLSTAGIGPVEDGYVIYVNSRAPGARRIGKTCLNITDEEFATFPAQIRFNVAHEMSHVFFFNLLDGDCRSALFRKHSRALENACNQMARVLLLPKNSFVPQLGNDLFAFERVSCIMTRFRVSPQVFIYRLRLVDMRESFRGHDPGLIACVRMAPDDRTRVLAAHALGDLAELRWPKRVRCRHTMSAEQLCLDADLQMLLRKRERVVTDSVVYWNSDKVAPCKVELNPIRQNPPTAILSIRLSGCLERRKT